MIDTPAIKANGGAARTVGTSHMVGAPTVRSHCWRRTVIQIVTS
jgi:hypothetical protein